MRGRVTIFIKQRGQFIILCKFQNEYNYKLTSAETNNEHCKNEYWVFLSLWFEDFNDFFCEGARLVALKIEPKLYPNSFKIIGYEYF